MSREKFLRNDEAIPNTIKMLDGYGWKIDPRDGFVSVKNGDTEQSYADETVTLSYREVVTSFSRHKDDVLYFAFSGNKQEQKRIPKTIKSPEEWLEIQEKIAISLARELNLSTLEVGGGARSKDILLKKGYLKCHGYTYKKNVK